jgi:hypothetical protein
MSGGIGTALTEVLDGFAEPKTLAEAGLFDDLDVAETGALGAKSPLSEAHPLAEVISERRRGRKPGSKNRRTEQTVRWLLSQHRHPLLVMMEVYSLSPAELAGRIGVSPSADNLLDLFKLQVRMAEAVAPYVAQRLPQAVELSGGADFTLSFGGVSFPARGVAPQILEGQAAPVQHVRLPPKSDAPSRTDG